MSDIFGGSFNIAIESGLDNSTFLANANSVGDAFGIIDAQLTIQNTSGLLLDPATHTLSEQLNFIALNTDNGLNAQYATISDLNTATTAIGIRLDSAEQAIQEHTNLIDGVSTLINNHLTDSTAHSADQIYYINAGGGTNTRGFFLSGDGTVDHVYSAFSDTWTATNAFKPDATIHPIAFKNRVFCFSSDSGGSFVSTDGGLNFSQMTTPWNVNNLITSAAVGEYTALGVNALLLGMSSGEFYYTLDGINFVLDPVTSYGNQILCLTWSDYSEWHFVVHNDLTGVYAFDWTGVSNGFQYTATLPFEPTSIGYDANYGPIISSPSGTSYFNWHTNTWIASTLFGSTQVYLNHSGNNVSGDYILLASTIIGDIYSYAIDMINGIITDNWALIDTIVEAGTVTSLTQYDLNKYLVTFGPAANALHQIVWFEYPFLNFHYQGGSGPIRNLTGGCSAIYADSSPQPITILLDSGAVNCNNVDDTTRALKTANEEIRNSGYITNSALSGYRTASAQDTIDSTHLTSSALTPYRTASAQDTIDSGKYSTSNPAGYIDSSALTPYRTASAQDTIDSGKYSTSNPDNYQTASQVLSAITSGTSGVYYPVTNPENYVKLSDANTAYYASSNPSNYITNSALAPYLTNTTAASTYATLTQFGYLAKPNMRLVSTIGVSSPQPGQAYDSLANALVGISAGTSVYILPGTYQITSTVTIPAGISIIGVDKKTTILNMTVTSANTMFICNAANISIQSITLNMNSVTNSANMKVIELQSNGNTFFIDNVIINVDNSTTTTASDVYGIYSTHTQGMTTDSLFHCFELIVYISSSSTGIKRCVYHNPSGSTLADLHFESCQMFVTNNGAGTDNICVETAGANSPELQLTNCFLQSSSSKEISQTTGRILLGKGTVLYNAGANGFTFDFFGSANNWCFSDDGTTNAGTRYFYRGVATSSNNLVPYRINKATCVLNMHVNVRVAPGAGESLVFTLMKNSVATALTCTVANTATTAEDVTHSIQFAIGDLLGLRCVSSGNNAADIIIQIDLY